MFGDRNNSYGNQKTPDYNSGKQSGDNQFSTKDRQKLHKEEERNYYVQQYKDQEDYESYKLREDAEKKRRLRQEMVDSYEQQIREKQARNAKSKQMDEHYSKTSQEISSFASQDKQREELLQKMKYGQAAVVNSNANQGYERESTPSYSQNYSQKQTPIQTEAYTTPFARDETLNSKKQKEREIFLENQRVANQKKNDELERKAHEKARDLYKVSTELEEFERQQAYAKSQRSRQGEDINNALSEQVTQKGSNKTTPFYDATNERRGGDDYYYGGNDDYSYPSKNKQAPTKSQPQYTENTSKSDYLKIKQRNQGGGYNIISHN